MTALIRAELIKLRTIRATYGTIAAAVAATALSVGITIAGAGHNGLPALDTVAGIRAITSSAANGCILALVIGTTAVAGEYRHNTIVSALLVTAHRGRVIAAKAAAVALIAVVVASLCTLVTLALGLPALSAHDANISWLSRDVAGVLAGCAAVTVLYALIGLGIGAIVRNQVAAVIGALVWQLIVENALLAVLPSTAKWLPLGAANALTQSGTLDHPLPIAAATLLLIGYTALAIAGGMRLTVTRDVA